MDIGSILFAGLFGGAGGALGVILARTLVKDDNTNVKVLRQIITVVPIFLLLGLWQLMLKPMFYDKPNYKNKMEKALLTNEMTNSLFKSMKLYDEKNYNLLLDELSVVATKPGAKSEDVSIAAANLGAVYSKKYFVLASDEEVYNYVKSYHAFLLSIRDQNPLLICQMEDPMVFGSPDPKLLENTKFFSVLELLGNIIKSAMNSNNSYNKGEAELLFNKMIEKYQMDFPKDIETLSLQENLTSAENVKRFAIAYIDLYAEVVENNVKDSANIYRYMRDQ